jgi:DNA-binding NarL/FixJ family response regulator
MSGPSAEIRRARDAAEAGAWREAYEVLRDVDRSTMAPADLELLADAAWWMSQGEASIAARQHAYAGFTASGRDYEAAGNAARLAVDHFTRGEPAVGAGWLAKAHRHAEAVPEGVGHGLLYVIDATVARFQGDLDRATELADRAAALGRRFGDPDLTAMAIHTQGLLEIARGRVPEGLALLDEAMASVLAGELTPFFTGIVYCDVIGACLELADVGRAGQWSDAARIWCETLPPESPFPGMCRVNRAEVSRLRGAWSEAEDEAARAFDELVANDPMGAARAQVEAGEIRRRRGDLAGAEECFSRAREIGVDPQPGLALLRAAQGKLDAAAAALRLAVDADDPESRLHRARLLAAQVDVALAMSDLVTASDAADAVVELAASAHSPALAATSDTARGALQLARGETADAVTHLRRAFASWRELKLPYEAARARATYGLALRAAGNEEDAVFELEAARSALERLGAVPDAAAVAAWIEPAADLPAGLTAREVEVLRLVAAGRSNRQIAEALTISEHTVARHLQNMFVKLNVSSRSAATAFAFEHDLA